VPDARWKDYTAHALMLAQKNHTVHVWNDGGWPDRPWRSLCVSCANEGRFAKQQEALSYADLHVSRRGGSIVQAAPKGAK
jgi:hypothetical protein